MTKKERSVIIGALSLLVAIGYQMFFDGGVPQTSGSDSLVLEEAAVQTEPYVTRVVDGDTLEILLDGREQKVRLVGIDTPESVDPRKPVQCFGKEATAHISELVLGKTVRLEIDETGDDVDTFGRLLRYVFVGEQSINEQMILDGYAYAYIKYPFSKRIEYLKAQTIAREGSRGLWSSTTCSGKP